MDKELVLHVMTNSFKQANLRLAVEKGMKDSDASVYIESMSESIANCMGSVLDDLIENFPDIIK